MESDQTSTDTSLGRGKSDDTLVTLTLFLRSLHCKDQTLKMSLICHLSHESIYGIWPNLHRWTINCLEPVFVTGHYSTGCNKHCSLKFSFCVSSSLCQRLGLPLGNWLTPQTPVPDHAHNILTEWDLDLETWSTWHLPGLNSISQVPSQHCNLSRSDWSMPLPFVLDTG